MRAPLALAAVLVLAPTAQAADSEPPNGAVGGVRTPVGGSVPSLLQLSMDDPSGAGDDELVIHTRVTSTDRATLSVAAERMAGALEARVGRGARDAPARWRPTAGGPCPASCV